jgi:hypothetical protein
VRVLGNVELAGVIDEGDCLETLVLHDQLVEETKCGPVAAVLPANGLVRDGNVVDGLLFASADMLGHDAIEGEEARGLWKVDKVNCINVEIDEDAILSIMSAVKTKAGVNKNVSLQSFLPRLLVDVQDVGNGSSGNAVM